MPMNETPHENFLRTPLLKLPFTFILADTIVALRR